MSQYLFGTLFLILLIACACTQSELAILEKFSDEITTADQSKIIGKTGEIEKFDDNEQSGKNASHGDEEILTDNSNYENVETDESTNLPFELVDDLTYWESIYGMEDISEFDEPPEIIGHSVIYDLIREIDDDDMTILINKRSVGHRRFVPLSKFSNEKRRQYVTSGNYRRNDANIRECSERIDPFFSHKTSSGTSSIKSQCNLNFVIPSNLDATNIKRQSMNLVDDVYEKRDMKKTVNRPNWETYSDTNGVKYVPWYQHQNVEQIQISNYMQEDIAASKNEDIKVFVNINDKLPRYHKSRTITIIPQTFTYNILNNVYNSNILETELYDIDMYENAGDTDNNFRNLIQIYSKPKHGTMFTHANYEVESAVDDSDVFVCRSREKLCTNNDLMTDATNLKSDVIFDNNGQVDGQTKVANPEEIKGVYTLNFNCINNEKPDVDIDITVCNSKFEKLTNTNDKPITIKENVAHLSTCLESTLSSKHEFQVKADIRQQDLEVFIGKSNEIVHGKKDPLASVLTEVADLTKDIQLGVATLIGSSNIFNSNANSTCQVTLKDDQDAGHSSELKNIKTDVARLMLDEVGQTVNIKRERINSSVQNDDHVCVNVRAGSIGVDNDKDTVGLGTVCTTCQLISTEEESLENVDESVKATAACQSVCGKEGSIADSVIQNVKSNENKESTKTLTIDSRMSKNTCREITNVELDSNNSVNDYTKDDLSICNHRDFSSNIETKMDVDDEIQVSEIKAKNNTVEKQPMLRKEPNGIFEGRYFDRQ